MPTIRLTFFWAKSATNNPSPLMVNHTNNRLRRHGFRLHVYPGTGTMSKDAHTLDYDEEFPDYEGTYLEPALKLRRLAAETYQDEGGSGARLPVIFVPFTVDAPTDGGRSMCSGAWGNTRWPPFAILNTKNAVVGGIPLLHEIGHCSGLEHDYSNHKQINFMYGEGTTALIKDAGIKPEQLEKIKMAYFVGG